MRNSSLHICALIPTYNNANTILDVVRRTRKQLKDVIVVVDGCTDNTLDLLQELEFPITIVSYSKNKGKGYALKQGFRKAIELGFEYALTIDSDGQHYPEDIPLLIDAIKKHPGSMIIGSRKLTSENVPEKNKFANKFSNFWFRLQTHINLPDTQTGFRIYPLNKLYGLSLLTSRYEAELLLLVLAAWHNVPLLPVDIRVYYPPKEERISHFRPALDFTRISILNTILCVGAIIYGYPMMYWSTIYSFGLWSPLMLLIVQPLSLLYFLICGKSEKSKFRYRTWIAKFSGWCIRHIPGLDASVNNPYNHNIGEKPTLYICNHQSILDIILIFSLTPKLIVLAKEWVWKNPVLGIILRLTDCLPITYGNEVNIERMREMVALGYSIMIFPEGTRTRNGDIGRFHRGAFYIAEQLSLDICPMLIRGMFTVLSKNEFRVRPSKVTLDIYPVIKTNDISFGKSYKERTKTVEKYYSNILNKRNEDTVGIIGAGVGGLFTAALLAERGYQVTLLEQLSVTGGGLYSYQRLGAEWLTGTHVICGMEDGGVVKNLLERLNISIPVEETFFDNPPIDLIGEHELEYFNTGAFRLIGGTQYLVDQLTKYIVRNGGRILNGEHIVKVNINSNRVDSIETTTSKFYFANVVSSIHPKQLLSIVTKPIFRAVTTERILYTPETFGSFKVYIRLKDKMLPHDPVTHYLPQYQLLVLTPPACENPQYAQTIECIMPLDYSLLDSWKSNRHADYKSYETFKKCKAQDVIQIINAIYPNINDCIADYFTSTSLSFRDIYHSPQGAMYGLSSPIGGVTTKVENLFLTGQNCFMHGFYGTLCTAIETVNAIENKYE